MTALPVIKRAQVVAEELEWLIRSDMNNHPRSRQLDIGASELGNPCIRSLIPALTAPSAGNGSWFAHLGTCLHAGLEAMLHRFNAQFTEPRFLVEQEVVVGQVRDIVIRGHVDAFDVDTSSVIDWKLVGAKRLEMFKRKGPGDQYRIQAHLYGRGLVALGHHVEQVMIMFLPRERDLHTYWWWAEPYDETVALAALARAEGLLDLVDVWGADEVAAMYPPCGAYYCKVCNKRELFPSKGVA